MSTTGYWYCTCSRFCFYILTHEVLYNKLFFRTNTNYNTVMVNPRWVLSMNEWMKYKCLTYPTFYSTYLCRTFSGNLKRTFLRTHYNIHIFVTWNYNLTFNKFHLNFCWIILPMTYMSMSGLMNSIIFKVFVCLLFQYLFAFFFP